MKNLVNENSLRYFFNKLKDIFATKEELNNSKPTRPPSSHVLDRSTTPWTIHFDNGSSIQFPDYRTTATVYGYGAAVNGYDVNNSTWPLVNNILSFAHGALTLEKLKATNNGADYWGDRTVVINPVNDASGFNFTNARFNNTGSTGYREVRQRNEIRVFYELGLLTESEILELGAVRK